MQFVCLTIILLLFPIAGNAATDAEAGGIVATIKPLHSLVTAVAGPEQEVTLLLTGNYSPHDFALRPSQMQQLQSAKVLFYIGEELETFLQQVLPSLPDSQIRKAVSRSPSIELLPARAAGIWAQHDDDHHDDADHHDTHGHADNRKDGHKQTDDHKNGHEQRGDHDRDVHHHSSAHDMHVWLDPDNAAKIAADIAYTLGRAFPENQARYAANAAALRTKLATLDAELKAALTSLKGRPFIQFHDSVQYFETRYGLAGLGAINLEPDDSPSAKRIGNIQRLIAERNVRCVFREPQYSDRLVQIVIADSGAASVTLDPLGTDLNPGPALYFQLMRDLATAMRECTGIPAP